MQNHFGDYSMTNFLASMSMINFCTDAFLFSFDQKMFIHTSSQSIVVALYSLFLYLAFLFSVVAANHATKADNFNGGAVMYITGSHDGCCSRIVHVFCYSNGKLTHHWPISQ